MESPKSDDVVSTCDDVVSTSDNVVSTCDDVVSTSDDVVITCGDVVSTRDDVVSTSITLETLVWICFSPSFDFLASLVGSANNQATNTTWPFYRIWLDWQIVSAAYKFCFIVVDTETFASILSFQIVSFFFKSSNVSAINTSLSA